MIRHLAVAALLLAALAGCTDDGGSANPPPAESRDEKMLARATEVFAEGGPMQSSYLWVSPRTGDVEAVKLVQVRDIGIQGEFLVDASRTWAAATSSLDTDVVDAAKFPITNLTTSASKPLDLRQLTGGRNFRNMAAWFDSETPALLHVGDGARGWAVDVVAEQAMPEKGVLQPTGGDLQAVWKKRTGAELVALDSEQRVGPGKLPDPGCFYEDLAYVDSDGTTRGFCRDKDHPEKIWMISIAQGADAWEKGADLQTEGYVEFFDLLLPPLAD